VLTPFLSHSSVFCHADLAATAGGPAQARTFVTKSATGILRRGLSSVDPSHAGRGYCQHDGRDLVPRSLLCELRPLAVSCIHAPVASAAKGTPIRNAATSTASTAVSARSVVRRSGLRSNRHRRTNLPRRLTPGFGFPAFIVITPSRRQETVWFTVSQPAW
jgi:hypothetical protein